MTIKLIAIDVDGTLLDDNHHLSPRNASAIRAATAAGIPVVLATGRMRTSCEWLLSELALETAGIFVQGLHIADKMGQRLHGEFLPADVIAHFLPFAEQHQLSFVAFGDNEIFTHKRDQYTNIMLDYNEPEPIVVANVNDHPIHKIIVLAEPDDIQAIRPILASHMGARADILITEAVMVEVMPTGTSKGHSLRWLAGQMGIEMADVLAIGNADNDLTMLQFAGVGVAMANATQRVLDIADFVTTSNNEAGVAAAIEQFVLTTM